MAGQMTLVYSKHKDLEDLQSKAEQLSYMMVESTGREYKAYEAELEALEEQIQLLEQELN